MIIIGTFEAVVMDAVFREFSSKENPNKTFKVNEVEFSAPTLGINGKIRDWDLSTPIQELTKGRKVKISYNRCQPVKGLATFFEFSGKVTLI